MRMLTEQLQDRRRWLREIIMFSVNTAILEILRPEHTNVNIPNLMMRSSSGGWKMQCGQCESGGQELQIKFSRPVLMRTTFAISINILSKKEQKQEYEQELDQKVMFTCQPLVNLLLHLSFLKSFLIFFCVSFSRRLTRVR